MEGPFEVSHNLSLPAFADLSLGIPPAKSPPKPPEAAGIDDTESPPPGRIDGGDLFPLDCLGANQNVNNYSLKDGGIKQLSILPSS